MASCLCPCPCNSNLRLLTIFLLVLFSTVSPSVAACESKYEGTCHDKRQALKFKVIAICSILVASMIGVCLPVFSRSVPALKPDGNLFVLVKAFASGVILATGYMHVLPDSFDDLRSECLAKNPWHKFPFTTFVAMLAAIFTLMVDSFSIGYFRKKISSNAVESDNVRGNEAKELEQFGIGHGHCGNEHLKISEGQEQLLKHRVVAQVLELGIVVHSVVIGLSMGASENPCTIRPLIAALCFHQFFEGMGLGGCILQAEYGHKMKGILVFFFSVTTPFGIALGIGLSNVYSDTSPTSLIVEGILNAVSAGLLNYMALVDLLASDFMGPKLQQNMKLQIWSYVAVLLGAGGMSLMAKWA
ncbi:fe(2+) transport protein 1-like [Prosopis cineraria]|uniref:fe(2+) transport protein 1-like n=1 Tax=Prosopis cineraria TaxID=364024 RepID=UPI00240FD4C3|nr:fe(2+) transport protein 1-like [Prosopis cineraria]